MLNLKKDTSFVIKGDQIHQVQGLLPSSVIVYERQSPTGLDIINLNDIDFSFDTSDTQFDNYFRSFMALISVKLYKEGKPGYEEQPYKNCVLNVIAQSLDMDERIVDEDEDDVRMDTCVDMALDFLAKMPVTEQLLPVKLYVIEQILQKHTYHILNDEWLNDKLECPELDTTSNHVGNIVMPEVF